MKAVIIENEYSIPDELEQFIRDNKGLFDEVTNEFGCLHRTIKDIIPAILRADAILVYSTFMYKDQLERMVHAFVSGPFLNTPLKFYGWGITGYLNEWNRKNAENLLIDQSFTNVGIFMDNITQLVYAQEVYDIGKHDDDDRVTARQIHYSPEKDLFY